MRWVIAGIFVVHGIAHLPGFTASGNGGWGRALGVGWLVAALGMVGTGVAVARRVPDWSTPALALLGFSAVLAVLGWPATRIGLVVSTALAVAILVGRGQRWFPNAGVHDLTPDQLWRSAPVGGRPFEPSAVDGMPEPARRYLLHAITPGTPVASATRLSMTGEIKLGGTWRRFSAVQVIVAGRGMIWQARVPMLGWAITGSDRLVDGVGGMRWRFGGLIPVMSGTGPDITRSALGRAIGEAIWLPGWLLDPAVRWEGVDDSTARYHLTLGGATVPVALTLSPAGAVTSARLRRWGRPGGEVDGEYDFGVVVDAETRFGGYTIPSQLRAGWFFGTPRFDREGEFIRIRIDSATHR